MPEYLAPGVYVEEVSFRPKSIEGVSTSVAGFIGPTRFGPVGGEPELLTSFADFERIYGGLDDIRFDDETGQPQLPGQPNYMAHAVRAFFDNGGSKLYVARVYQSGDPDDPLWGHASLPLPSPAAYTLRSRFPGLAGQMRIIFALRSLPMALRPDAIDPSIIHLSGAQPWMVVYVRESPLATGIAAPTVAPGLYDVVPQGTRFQLENADGATVSLDSLDPTRHIVHRVVLTIRVRRPGRFEDEMVWDDVAVHPRGRDPLTGIFAQRPDSRLRQLTIPFWVDGGDTVTSGAALLPALVDQSTLDALSLYMLRPAELRALSPFQTLPPLTALETRHDLTGGSDGALPIADAYRGEDPTDPDDDKTGLKTFEDVEEISIVAAPGATAGYNPDDPRANTVESIIQNLIIHCELRMKYRVAILDAPNRQIVSEIQAFRGQFDSTHAAMYYPWITVVDPLDPDGRRELNLPPSGFMAGIYARNDVVHGVVKAPANEVVLGAVGFETLINKAQHDILNPVGINAFRFFEGRGFRAWGARTISSDPEWKYISVRRYFAYLEHSIDRGTQWAVFENNSESLWANVRQTVADFLFNEWRNGALMGERVEDAFFVRCDRSTMTQNDLDNGRLICLIGVAVVKPAEFVIFRIGQWTADRRAA